MALTAPPIPRVELANAPTPLLKLERLSGELGVELWVKRDDLTGLLETGNKIRKLEFLVGEALAQNADTLITCGTLQSNCCRTVAAVCARLGLRAVVALKGAPPAEYDGNLLLDRLLGADVRYCSDADWAKIDEVLEEMDVRLPPTGSPEFALWPGFRDESFELPVYWLCIGRFPQTFAPEVLGLNLAMELSGVGGSYRRAHMAHHRDEMGPEEPDAGLYAGYPIPPDSLRRLVAPLAALFFAQGGAEEAAEKEEVDG